MWIKKVLFTLVVLSVSPVVYAQTSQGSVFAGGSARFSFNNVKHEIDDDNTRLGNQTTVEFSPKVGYFIDDGIAIGLVVDWQRESFKNNDDDRIISSYATLSPFARYYTALGPFFHAQLGFGGGSDKIKPDVGDETEESYDIFSYGFGVGYPYFLNDNVSLEPVIFYRAYNEKYEDDEKLKYRGLMIELGLVYYIF